MLERIRIRAGRGKFDLNTGHGVDVEIFEPAKKNLRIQKYPDTYNLY